MMRRRGTTPSRKRQVLSLVLGCAFLSAMIAQVTHSPALGHAVCADHGKLIHVGPVAAEQCVPLDVADQAPGQDPGEEHEHCAFPTASREIAAAAASPVVARGTTPTPAAVLLRVSVHCTFARYRVAPKNSPPLA